MFMGGGGLFVFFSSSSFFFGRGCVCVEETGGVKNYLGKCRLKATRPNGECSDPEHIITYDYHRDCNNTKYKGMYTNTYLIEKMLLSER